MKHSQLRPLPSPPRFRHPHEQTRQTPTHRMDATGKNHGMISHQSIEMNLSAWRDQPMSQIAKREDLCLPVLVHLVKRDVYLHSSRVRDDKKHLGSHTTRPQWTPGTISHSDLKVKLPCRCGKHTKIEQRTGRQTPSNKLMSRCRAVSADCRAVCLCIGPCDFLSL